MGNNNTARQTGAKGAPAVSATPTAEVEKRAADAGVVSPDRNTPEETDVYKRQVEGRSREPNRIFVPV